MWEVLCGQCYMGSVINKGSVYFYINFIEHKSDDRNSNYIAFLQVCSALYHLKARGQHSSHAFHPVALGSNLNSTEVFMSNCKKQCFKEQQVWLIKVSSTLSKKIILRPLPQLQKKCPIASWPDFNGISVLSF